MAKSEPLPGEPVDKPAPRPDLADKPRHRWSVGPPEKYDLIGAMQFTILTTLGLREHHFLLDIGCGSLRAGRLFIPYLLPERYFGIEPARWLVEAGIEKELGRDAVRIKRPTFMYSDDFGLSAFDREFDFMVANSIFTHAAARQVRTCLAEVKKVLKGDGTLAATYSPGEFNYDGAEWTQRARYTPEFMASLVEEAGLECATLDWPHPNTHQRWLLICHEGAAERASTVRAPGGQKQRR